MSNNLTNAYTLSQDLKESTDNLKSHQNDLKGIKTSQTVFSIGTYFIYFSFTSVIFAGVTVWNLQDYIFGNYTNVIGMVWALVTVFVIPAALSLAKHFNYKAIAKGSASGESRGVVAVRAIIALALLSGLYYEAISASSNLQAKAFHAVDYKSNLQNILAAPATAGSSGALAGQIADAEFKLVSCQRKLAEGKLKDCDNSTAKVNSFKNQAQADRESAAAAGVAAIGAKKEALTSAVSEQALPAAKYIAEAWERSNDFGTMVVVIIAALFFELIHITTIFNEARALRAIEGENANLKNLNGHYFSTTGKTFDKADFRDNRKIDLSDTPLNIPAFESNGVGNNTAPAAHFKWHNKPQEPVEKEPAEKEHVFGFIRPGQTAATSASLDAENRRKYPQQILYPTGNGRTADDYSLIPRKERTNTPTLTSPSLPKGSKGSETSPTASPDFLKGAEGSELDQFYALFKAHVQAGGKFSEPACFELRKASQFFSQLGKVKMNPIWNECLDRMAAEGVLLANPAYVQGSTKPKYILA